MIAAVAFALVYGVHLTVDRRRRLSRRPLSDEEFAAQLPDRERIDPSVVREVRALAAKRFRRVGGDRFYPNDRLEEDLHLFDAAPWAFEHFEIDITERFGELDEEVMKELGPVETFGDIVVLAHRTWQRMIARGEDERGSRR